ncbi:MAG: fibronectin type III domain-containing protein [Treponema sp.]|jgi:predicted phosphodiesterase|nr:fibronectin type III domain-containing protein [Treponema sp.]
MKKIKTMAVLLALAVFCGVFMWNCDDSNESSPDSKEIEYTITVINGSANKTKAFAKDTITLTPGTVTDKVFTDWTIDPPNVAMTFGMGNKFTMPSSNVTVTGNFEDIDVYSNIPYNITNNFGQDSSTSLLVKWHQDEDVLNQTIKITPAAGSFSAPEKTIQPVAKTFYTSGQIGNISSRNVFNAEITGLTPNTLYKYRVGADGTGWSQVFYHFTSRNSDTNFSFTVISDSQDASEPQEDMRTTLRAANNYDSDSRFFLHCGDVVERIGSTNKSPIEIECYTNAANDFNVQRPIITTQGNHDCYYNDSSSEDHTNEATIFNGFMTFAPNGEEQGDAKSRSYYFYYNRVLFIMLNTMVDTPQHIAQAVWLDKILEHDRDNNLSRYRIVATHKGPFGNHYYEESRIPEMRRTYGPIYTKYKVDIVFHGHDHTYTRSVPVKLTATTEADAALDKVDFTSKPADGTIYSIAGSTGAKKYGESTTAPKSNPLWDKGYVKRTRNTADIDGGLFINVKVTANELIVNAMRTNGVKDDYLPDSYKVPIKK